MIKKLNYIFTKKEKIRLAGVFLLILIGSFMELLEYLFSCLLFRY